jgi:hypothetical protein
MHFVVKDEAADAAALAKLAASLSSLTAPGASDGLDPDTRSIIRNFAPT